MEKYFALIKNNLVHSIIIANEDFIKHIEKDYDHIIEVDPHNRPHPGSSYYPVTKSFVENHTEIIHIPSSEPAPSLNFKPFQLSKYQVTHENDFIIIGCKKYSAAGFIEALKKIIGEKEHTTSHFTSLDKGPAHGKFDITWADAQKLYDIIVKGLE